MLMDTLTSAEANSSEEPGAGKLHAGICEGAVGQLAVSTSMTTYPVWPP